MNKKNTLSAMALLFSCLLLAQQAANTFQERDTAGVSKSGQIPVPNGILLDFGMEFTNLQALDVKDNPIKRESAIGTLLL